MRISDWSSDVCSSDLQRPDEIGRGQHGFGMEAAAPPGGAGAAEAEGGIMTHGMILCVHAQKGASDGAATDRTLQRLRRLRRSEERRVGKEYVDKCRSRWSP